VSGQNRGMAEYTKVNLKRDVKDAATEFGYAPLMESRFAREPLGLRQSGVSYFRLAPDFRMPFGHSHGEQEEVYVVIGGSVRLRLDEEELELGPLDAVRIPTTTKRALQGGPEGGELLAFGAPNTENKDVDVLPGWWGE
jgi:mannose-6-phosphate isomerase-like protein (cupin superfamily)